MPGYDAKLKSELQHRHECPVCFLPMRNPVQTECGHLFCRDCLEPILKRRRPVCPLDQEPISKEETFPDNACRREILNLQVYCSNKSAGCQWGSTLGKLEAHLEDCPFREEQCQQCGRKIQFLNLEHHEKVDCPMRPSPCPHCGSRVPADQLQTHIEKTCPEVLHFCPNKCNPNLQMKLSELEHHLDKRHGDCPLSEVDCPFIAYGCQYNHMLRKDIREHMDHYWVVHSHLQADFNLELKKQQVEMQVNNQQIFHRLESIEDRIAEAERSLDTLETRADVLESDRKDRSSERYAARISSLEEKISQMQFSLDTVQRQVDASGVAVAGLVGSDGLSGYGRRKNGYSSAFTSLGAGSAYTTAVSQRVDSLFDKVTELDRSISRTLSGSLDQDLRLQLLERATHDGKLLWKIDEFARRRREAIEGITLSLYSTPFYTSHQGYKMCARVYLNGDGMGKNTHLSLFFVIMRGPYDALLEWPFAQTVHLFLINQEGKKNVTDSFRPDPDSSSFQRPMRRDMNIASGCPKFCRMDYLLSGGFLKDDCIFLGIVVNTQNLKDPL